MSFLQVGQVIMAKFITDICDIHEVGVCCGVNEINGRPSYRIIFEKGGYDGFSPDEVREILTVSDIICDRAKGYKFTDAGRLAVDHQDGIFTPAFAQGNIWKASLEGMPGTPVPGS